MGRGAEERVNGATGRREVAQNMAVSEYFYFMSPGDISEKAMATHSSVPAWRIPGTGEPGRLPSMGWHRV